MKDSDTKIICLIFPEKLTNKMGWALGVTENSQVLCHTHTEKISFIFERKMCKWQKIFGGKSGHKKSLLEMGSVD